MKNSGCGWRPHSLSLLGLSLLALRLLATGLVCGLPCAAAIRTVYIVPSSHYDRGFVLPPSQIPSMAAQHIGELLDAAEGDPNFRWTIESVWQVLAFIEQERGLGDILTGHPERIDRLMRLIRSGRVDLSVVWGSMHAEFMGADELNRLAYDFADLHRIYGINSQLAVMNDVPGQPWGVASVLAGSGVRYLLIGANQFVGGGTSLAPGNVPFYWQGPDGQKVLTWVSQSPRGGYTEAITDYFLDPFTQDPYLKKSGWEIFNPNVPEKTPLETMQAGMNILLKKYSDAGYPYDAVLAMHVHDFLHPSTVRNLERAVQLWNGAHKTPELRIATASEFFRHMEQKYGAKIPTVRGEWSGLWSEAKTSSPEISALARRAHTDVPAAETLWNALAAERNVAPPTGTFYHLYHLLFDYDEHSGAGNAGWPGLNELEKLQQQNREYVGFMRDADVIATGLVREAIALIAGNESGVPRASNSEVRTQTLAVWNALSWRRTDVVRLGAADEGWHVSAVRDRRNGQAVPFDIDSEGTAIFVARDVPSVGYAIFDVDESPGPATCTIESQSSAKQIENARYRVAASATGEIASIFDIGKNRELVNQRAGVPFNRLLRIENDEPAPIAMPFAPKISARRGRVVTELDIERSNSAFRATSVRLHDGVDRVEIQNRIDSPRLPFASIRGGFDSYYFSFPFALDPATLAVHPEEPFGFLSLPGDYLPGARRDSVTSQHAIALSDARATAVLAHRQAFYFVFPGYVHTEDTKQPSPFPAMFTGKWPLPEATLYSRAFRHTSEGDMRFLGITAFPTVEPGLGDEYLFDYALKSEGVPFDSVASMRFGAQFDSPLRAEYVPFARAVSESYLGLDQSNVLVKDMKQAESGVRDAITPTTLSDAKTARKFVIRLQEIAGRDTPHALLTVPGQILNAEIVNLTEDHVLAPLRAGTPLDVALRPYQTLTVRIELQPEQKKQ